MMMKFEKPKRVTLSAQIIEQMERCIQRGDWMVGERIPSELELMETFGVSRNTIREAVLSLVYAGMLHSIPGDGTYVMGDSRLGAALQQRLKRARLTEILEARLVLETDIVSLASQRRTEEGLKGLKALAKAREEGGLTEKVFMERDKAFHLQIAKECHNGLLYDMYTSFLSIFDQELLVAYLNSPEADRQHNEHNALISAIEAQDGAGAAEIVRSIIEMERILFRLE